MEGNRNPTLGGHKQSLMHTRTEGKSSQTYLLGGGGCRCLLGMWWVAHYEVKDTGGEGTEEYSLV